MGTITSENPDTLEAANIVGSKNRFSFLQLPSYKRAAFKKKSSLSKKTKKSTAGHQNHTGQLSDTLFL